MIINIVQVPPTPTAITPQPLVVSNNMFMSPMFIIIFYIGQIIWIEWSETTEGAT